MNLSEFASNHLVLPIVYRVIPNVHIIRAQHSSSNPGLLPYTSLPNTAYLLLSLGWAYPNSELWQKWLPSFLVTVDRHCSWPTFKWNHYAIEQGLPQTLTVKGEKTRTNGGSSAKIRPQLQKLLNQGNTQHCISLSFHLFLHSFTLRLVDLSPCRPLEIVLGKMDLQGPGPYRSRKIIYSAWPDLSISQQSSWTVESGHPKTTLSYLQTQRCWELHGIILHYVKGYQTSIARDHVSRRVGVDTHVL